ncbi:MAG: membrane protein insertase YidC [Alphaproteobacteria bacterium]|nr:membrane protein insertase YidC [Alphaproteobacteria bacterium]
MIEQKNVMVAIVISIVILFGWQYFIEAPRIEKQQALVEQQRLEEEARQKAAGVQPAVPGQAAAPGTAPGLDSGLGPNLGAAGLSAGATAAETREAALSKTPRVQIRSDRLDGSIALIGGRVDDLILRDYREELGPESPNIVLLHPTQVERPYYAEFGWVGKGLKLPHADTRWNANGTTLSPEKPVTLSWDNGEGLVFEQTYSLDENYMIALTQRVKNTTGAPITVTPYGLLSRTGTPEISGFYILHEGLIGVFNDTLKETDYDDVREGDKEEVETTGGWLGITDKYWLATLIPDQKEKFRARFIAGKRGPLDLYQADYLAQPRSVPTGGTGVYSTHLFAGAKEVKLLDKYEAELGVPLFDKAVDFGIFYWLTKPIFYAIHWLNEYLGNFGLAILALTVGIKLVFFPLANKSYKSMSKMKLLQPKLVELRDKYGEDKQRLNQEMMALYKKEGANPAAGCLPILVQIPVFFALYKVLFVNIEMRQAPFYGWIHDLSAPDPLGFMTAFGLVPWDVPTTFAIANIGIWPIIMGFTMYLQQKLNPAPTDPIQAKVFMFMPLIFTFLLGSFPAGLVIYWAWNNVLSISQQWVIMRRQGVSVGGGPVAGSSGGKST